MRLSEMKTSRQVIEEHRREAEFREVWDKTAFAREVAIEIVRYRTEHGLTQSALAARVGMTQSVIARLESGEQAPSIATLVKLSAGTGLEFHIDVSRGVAELAVA